MDKIYVVTQGCYSDYHIDKIFSTRKAAEKYCALQNAAYWGVEQSEMDTYAWELECRVEEYPLDAVRIMEDETPLKKRYVYFSENGEEHFTSHGVVYAEKDNVQITQYAKDCFYVAAILDNDVPEEKVKKIIYDEIAWFKSLAKENTEEEE